MGRLLFIVLVLSGTPLLANVFYPEGLIHPLYPHFFRQEHQQGAIGISVTFDGSGKATTCHVIRSTAGSGLNLFTCDFIRQNWRSPRYAGTVQETVIEFRLEGENDDLWNFPPLTVALIRGKYDTTPVYSGKFDNLGFIESCRIKKSCGLSALDREMMAWMRQSWHCNRDAGRILNLPMYFTSDRYGINCGLASSQK